MTDACIAARQVGIRQRSLGPRCRMGRATQLVFVLVTGVTLALSGRAEAQTWDGETSTDWTVVTNWDPDALPIVTDTATIDGSGATNPAILAGDAVTVDAVTVSGGTLTVSGALTAGSVTISGTGTVRVEDGIAPDGVLTGTVGVESGGKLSVAGLIDGTVRVNAGTLELDGGIIDDGTPTHRVEIQNGGIVRAISDTTLTGSSVGVPVGETGTITADAGVTLTLATSNIFRGNGSTTTFGTAGVAGTVVIGPTSTLSIGSFSVIDVAGGTVKVGSAFIGEFYFSFGTGISTSVDAGATIDMNGFNTSIQRLSGAGTITNDGAAAATLTLTNPAGGDTTFSGVIEDGTSAVALTKTGAGTLTLTGANTYTGITTISAGTLAVTGSITSIVSVGTGGTLSIAGQVNGSVAVNGGTVRLDGGNVSGSLDLLGGGVARAISDTTLTGSSVSVPVGETGTITADAGVTLTLATSNIFRGAGSTTTFGTAGVAGTVVIAPTVTIVIGGNSVVNVAGGTLQVGSEFVGSGYFAVFTSNSTSVDAGATIDINGFSTNIVQLSGAGTITNDGAAAATLTLFNPAGGDTTFSGVIEDGTSATALTKSGVGTLTLSGANTYTGATTISTGTLQIGNGGTTGTLGTGNVVNNAALVFNRSNDITVANVISGTGSLTKEGAGTLTLTGVNNAFTGAVEVIAGTLAVTGDGMLGTTGASQILVRSGSTLETDGGALAADVVVILTGAGSTVRLTGDETVRGLSTAEDTTVDLDGGTVTITGNPTFIGRVTGSGGITASGPSAVVRLEGTNDYTGTTTITGGGRVHVVGGAAIADTAAVEIEAGTFELLSNETIGTLSGAGSVALTDNVLTIAGSGSTTYSGVVSGTGGLTKTGTGTLTLSGANTFTGGLTVDAGIVALSGGAALADTNAVTVELDAILRLIDSERMGTLTNRGTVDLSGGNGVAGTVLTVNGNYNAASDLVLDVVLGDDNSAADRLVVEGDTSGTTSVYIVNQGGTGALTGTGILLVDVEGSSDGTFVLANADTLLPGDELGISAGVYVYALRNLAGDWVLQSQLQGFAVAYEALPSALLGLTRGTSLSQRLAGRKMMTSPKDDGLDLTASSKGGAAGPAMSGAWLSVRASDRDVTPGLSATGLTYDQSAWRVQAGLDVVLSEGAGGTWVVGGSVFNGGGELQARSALGDGLIATDATGAGLTATWYGDTGFYGDLQLEYSRFESDLSASAFGALASDVRGSGRFASVEIGKTMALQNGLRLTPQAQISWAKVSMDSFTGTEGTLVSVPEQDSLQLRLGLAAERVWTNASGAESRIYGLANLTQEFRAATSVLIDGVALDASGPDLTAEIGIGGSIDWQQAGGGMTSLYGEVTALQGLGGGDMTGVSGTAGLRVTW